MLRYICCYYSVSMLVHMQADAYLAHQDEGCVIVPAFIVAMCTSLRYGETRSAAYCWWCMAVKGVASSSKHEGTLQYYIYQYALCMEDTDCVILPVTIILACHRSMAERGQVAYCWCCMAVKELAPTFETWRRYTIIYTKLSTGIFYVFFSNRVVDNKVFRTVPKIKIDM